MVFNNTIFLNSTLVDRIEKNKLEELRVSVLKNSMIDCRLYFYFPNDPEPKPTKKGIWVPSKNAPEIIAAFEKLQANKESDINLSFEKSKETEQLRVYTADFRKNKLVHIRTYYKQDEEFKPGRGVSFSMGMLDKVTEAFKKALTVKTDQN